MKSRRRKVIVYRALREMDVLKKQLEQVSQDVEGLSDPHLVEISQKLDRKLNELQRWT